MCRRSYYAADGFIVGSYQSYCDQVRQAVATYGYAAAKRHALAHYSKHEVEVADRCVRGGHRVTRHARHVELHDRLRIAHFQ
jgi:hypothetical protein